MVPRIGRRLHAEQRGVERRAVDRHLRILYVAAARRDAVPIKGKVLSTVKGSELVGLAYQGPFDELAAQEGVEHRVVAWD